MWEPLLTVFLLPHWLCLSLSDQTINWKLQPWILKEHYNFSYLWKFGPDTSKYIVSENFSLKNLKLKILQGMFRFIKAFCQPPILVNFGCCCLQRAENYTNCSKWPFSPSTVDLNIIVLTVTSSLSHLYVSGKKQLSSESTCLQFWIMCVVHLPLLWLAMSYKHKM